MGPSRFVTCSLFRKRSFMRPPTMLNCGQLYPLILLLLTISRDDQSSIPLCLRIIDPSHKRMATLSGPLQTFMKPKYRGAERCTSLMICDYEWDSGISSILALLPRELSSLKHLSVSDFGGTWTGAKFPNCPLLERVEILDHQIRHLDFWGTNFTHVTTLSFGNKNVWGQYDMTLSLFPLLYDLTLLTTGRMRGWGIFSYQPSVQFHYLRILRVHGAIPSEILTRVVAPALEELHIEANSLHLTSIDELLISFGPLCLHLYAFLPEGISVGDPMWATSLSTLVEKCTRLEALYISKWMEEECKKFIDHSKVAFHVL